MADMIRKSTHTTAEIDAAVDMLLEVYTREEIDNLLSRKITAVPGKGLSTNDFTDADKSKLDGLENYDDTDVKAEIAKTAKQTALNHSTLGYQRKNLLINNCITRTTYGVTATVNADKSITLTGANSIGQNFIMFANMTTGATATLDQYDGNKKFLPNGKYIVSGGNAYCTIQVTSSENNTSARNIASAAANDVLFTVGDADKYVWFRLLVKDNADFSTPVTVYPMIRLAEITDDTYEPYKPSVEERLNKINARTELKFKTISATADEKGSFRLTDLKFPNDVVVSVVTTYRHNNAAVFCVPFIGLDGVSLYAHAFTNTNTVTSVTQTAIPNVTICYYDFSNLGGGAT